MAKIERSQITQKNVKVYTFGIIWGNPYTSPPDNLPRRLASYESFDYRPSTKLQRKFDAIINSLTKRSIYGYHQSFDCETINPIRWSRSAKQRVRLKRCQARERKKFGFPALWMDSLQQKIAQKPEYYGMCAIETKNTSFDP